MTSPYFQDDQVTVWHGDCLDVLPTLGAASVDAICTDPPYELAFMNKTWDATGIAYNVELWRECLRILKPGGHLLAFGGCRTHHRLAVAIEDAGFEIRDSIAWLYGSGFPKSLSISKAIDRAAGELQPEGKGFTVAGVIPGRDMLSAAPSVGYIPPQPVTDAAKQWQGWGTALKPAFEPIVVARKPIKGNVAANVQAHGTGALNIDATRVAADGANLARFNKVGNNGWCNPNGGANTAALREQSGEHQLGRWPANVVLDGEMADELDKQNGVSTSRTGGRSTRGESSSWKRPGLYRPGRDIPRTGHDDEGGASRFFPTFKYCAKAPSDQRPTHNGTSHATVKPLDLMRWLVRLVTPPHGLVLDPFAGTGTTAEAAIHEHMRAIVIEREPDYLPLIVARLTKPMAVGFDFNEET